MKQTTDKKHNSGNQEKLITLIKKILYHRRNKWSRSAQIETQLPPGKHKDRCILQFACVFSLVSWRAL